MELENKVVSLELAKKLKELGFSQKYKKGDLVWFQMGKKPEKWNLELVTIHGSEHKCKAVECECECDVCYPYANKGGIKAYTVAELFNIFPKGFYLGKDEDEDYYCGANGEFMMDINPDLANKLSDKLIEIEEEQTEDKNSADCLAKMLIYLKENKLI